MFEGMADRYVAEVVSEAFEPDQYKFVYTLEGTDFTPDDGFPPEPSALSSLAVVFIARDGNIKRFAAHGISGTEFEPTDEQLIEAYAGNVAAHSDDARIIEQFAEVLGLHRTHPRFGRLGQWAIETTQEADKRLIAAHFVFMTGDRERVHDALVYPSVMKETFPLLVRQAIQGMTLRAPEADDDTSPPGLTDTMRDFLQPIMLNTEEAQARVAGLPAGSVMPPLANYEATLKMHRQTSS